MELYFVTSNENKIKEAENILQQKINSVSLDIDEIQEIDVEKIVEDKARRAYEKIKEPLIVEDTGIYIKAWNGFPGALIKWVLKTIGNEGLCKILQEEDRTTTAKTSICFYDGSRTHIFTGEIEGQLTEHPKGESGFGWDPIFQPNGYEKTFAEMSQEEKDKISMRKIALTKLKEFLEDKD